MKYKKGDKFIIEIEAVGEGMNPYLYKTSEEWYEPYVCEEWYEPYVCGEFLDRLQPLTMTAEEAWETAKQILFEKEFTHDVLNEIFGTMNHYGIMRDLKPDEVKAKIDEWKKQKEEVKVGDVLRKRDTTAVVTRKEEYEVYVLFDDGSTSLYYEGDIDGFFEKTGEHIDLDAIFEQLGGKKND